MVMNINLHKQRAIRVQSRPIDSCTHLLHMLLDRVSITFNQTELHVAVIAIISKIAVISQVFIVTSMKGSLLWNTLHKTNKAAGVNITWLPVSCVWSDS